MLTGVWHDVNKSGSGKTRPQPMFTCLSRAFVGVMCFWSLGDIWLKFMCVLSVPQTLLVVRLRSWKFIAAYSSYNFSP